jgi:hypothetical protein
MYFNEDEQIHDPFLRQRCQPRFLEVNKLIVIGRLVQSLGEQSNRNFPFRGDAQNGLNWVLEVW